MAVLVIADHDNSALKDNTHKVVTAALAVSGDVDVLVAGQGCKAVAEAAHAVGALFVLAAGKWLAARQAAPHDAADSTARRPRNRPTATAAPSSKPAVVAITHAAALTPSDRPK